LNSRGIDAGRIRWKVKKEFLMFGACPAARRLPCRMFLACFLLAALFCGYAPSSRSVEDGPELKEWNERLAAAAKRNDAAEEVNSLTTIGRRWSWELSTMPASLIEQAATDSEHAGIGAPRFEMLQILYDRRWRYPNGREPSRWWRQLSLDLLARNLPKESFSVAAHISDPYDLVALQADNRYKQIARSEFVERDVLTATQKELERRQAAAADVPRQLNRVVEVARALMLLNRYEDVLRLTDPVLARKNAASPDVPPYDDVKREFPWLLDLRARALRALGRYDDALELLRRACEESKDEFVNHPLNLAIFLAELNRPQEALADLPPLEHANVYGHALEAQVRVMAASELDDTAGVQAALDEMRDCCQEYPGTRERALIIAGRDDEAAALLAARLLDPAQRTDALVELQDYADPPAPARQSAWRESAKALRTRPEIRQAITTYGRIRAYKLPGIGF
jgi:tetratricopeptide (TPR) repeat protein